MTISSSVFAAFLIAAAAELLLPVVLLLILCVKKIISPKPMFLGAAAFFVSQICLRIPLLQAAGTQSWFQSFALNTVPYLVMLSITAGLFEESARYLCAGCFLKKQRAFRDALAFGLGHGFCEVILLTGMAQINNIIYTVMINNGSFSTIAAKLPSATAQQLLSAMTSATPPLIYVGILERVFAVTFHIFASVLIFKGVNEKKVRYYFFAIAAHAVLDFGSVALTRSVNVWAGEGFAFAIALAALFLILRMKPEFPKEVPYSQALKA
ncbi:YhfC family intramembrane metalloprotease [Caproiciproducens faecalis]|uniref:YhfC family intramembrane metalloprotease n=1 Tax=Caproiciproducens faecalis TaxID=2820301 RepID=A0ABS7DKM6_9FIRM|nr:YhfC family glutamic-type intramembrane protease [Caproiciproducens faecalis]MBW7571818.1 YhfC family intramembrane metalloprotease [Caproiciproducens faecalis]